MNNVDDGLTLGLFHLVISSDLNIIVSGGDVLGLNLHTGVIEDLVHFVGIREHLVSGENIGPNSHCYYLFIFKLILSNIIKL